MRRHGLECKHRPRVLHDHCQAAKLGSGGFVGAGAALLDAAARAADAVGLGRGCGAARPAGVFALCLVGDLDEEAEVACGASGLERALQLTPRLVVEGNDVAATGAEDAAIASPLALEPERVEDTTRFGKTLIQLFGERSDLVAELLHVLDPAQSRKRVRQLARASSELL